MTLASRAQARSAATGRDPASVKDTIAGLFKAMPEADPGHYAALEGDSTRFTRQDGVEEAWRVMAPLLEAPPAVHPYAKGSWGPAAADELIAGTGRWHGPRVAS